MAISDQSLTSNETLFLALTKNAYKCRSPWATRFKWKLFTTPSDPQYITPCIKIQPPSYNFLSLLIFPHPIIYFKQQYFYFKMKLITYLKAANRVTHNHLVLRTTFHNKQMMSSSGNLVLSFLYFFICRHL